MAVPAVRSARVVLAVLPAILVMIVVFIQSSVRGSGHGIIHVSADGTVEPGVTPLSLLGTFDDVRDEVAAFQNDASDNVRAIELPGVVGLETVQVTLPKLDLIDIDESAYVITLPGRAEILDVSVDVMIGVVWTNPGSTNPGTSLGIRAPDLTLDAINPEWLAGVAPSFDTTWISLSSVGHDLPSGTSLAAFYDDDADPTTLPEFTLGSGASYLGNLDIASALGEAAAQAIGFDRQVVPLSGLFVKDFGTILNGDFSVPDLSLAGSLDALQGNIPSWMDIGTTLWNFGIDFVPSTDELSVTMAGQVVSEFPDNTVIDISGTAAYDGDEVQIVLKGSPQWNGTFGKDWVEVSDLLLTVAFDTDGSVAASFGADLTIAALADTYRATIGVQLADSVLTATFDVDGTFGLGDAIEIVNQNLDGDSQFGPEGFGDQLLDLTGVSFSVTKSSTETAFSLTADVRVRDAIDGSLLVGLTSPDTGNPLLLMGLHLEEITLVDFLGDAVEGLEGSPLGDLKMPEVNLTFAQELGTPGSGDPNPPSEPADDQEVSSEELDPTARSFYAGIYGVNVDFSFDVGGGITQQSRIDLRALGQSFVDALGITDEHSETIVTGDWGVSFDLSGGLPIDLTSLNLSAELPDLEFALPSWAANEDMGATQIEPSLAFGYEEDPDPNGGGSYTVEVGGELTLDVDSANGPETFGMRLKVSLNPTTGDYEVEVAGSLSDWEKPFELEWLTLDVVSLEFSYSSSGNSSTVSATLESEFTVKRKFALSISIDVNDDGTQAEFSASLVDPISLAEIIGNGGLVDEAFGVSIPLNGVLEELGDLSLGCVGDSPALKVTIRVGREDSFAIGACASVTLADSDFATDIFFSVKDAAKGSGLDYIFGLSPRANISLSAIMPDLPDGVAFELPELSLIAANNPVNGSSSDDKFSTDEREFFEKSYGQSSGADFKIDISVGINLNVILDFDVVLAPLFPAEDGDPDPEKGDQESIGSFKEALWMADDPVLMTGTLPLFGSDNLPELKMTLPRMVPSEPPEWFDSVNGGQLFIELSPDRIALGGEISMKLRRSDDRIGIEIAECDMGVQRETNNEDTGIEETLCFDVLTFALSFALQKGVPPSLNLTGALKTEAPWEQPLGIEWLTVNGAALQLQVKLSATPTIGFGFQGDMVIGEKDLFGAVSIGITIIQAPPFAIPRPLGVRGASEAGFGLLDIVAVAEAVSGGHISIGSMPDISLRNLELMFALGDNPDLCLETGFVISGDLYIDGGDFDGKDADPKCPFPGPDPSAPTCAELKGEGCFARADFSLTADGLFATGELTDFELGPIVWEDAILDIDLPLGLTGQKFQVKGGASAGSDDCPDATPCFFEGLIDLSVANPFPGPAFDLLADVRVLDGFYAEVEAEAGLDLIRPEFDAHAVMGSSFNTEIAEATRPLIETASVSVLLIRDIWQSMTGEIAADPIDVLLDLPSDLIAIGEDPPNWLTALGDSIGTLEVVSAFGDGDGLDGEELLEAVLNGFTGPAFPGLPDGGRSPAAVCLPFGFGPGGECWLLAPSPAVTVTICAFATCTTRVVIPALPGIPGVVIPPGCTLVESEVDGRCYIVPPFNTGEIPGICEAIGVKADPAGSDCEQEDLANQLIEPLLDGALQAIAGKSDLTFTDALTMVADRLSGTGVVFSVECADFRGELGELTSSGGSGVAVAFGITLFDEPTSLGLEWRFADEDGSVIDFANGLVQSILNPSPATCSQIEKDEVDGSNGGGGSEPGDTDSGDDDSDLVGVAAGRAERPTFLDVEVSADTITEGDEVTLTGVFDDPGDPSSHVVRVKWADGTSSRLDVATGKTTFEVFHRYEDVLGDDEAYRPVVTLEHSFAGSLTSVVSVLVENSPPDDVMSEVASTPIFEGDEWTLHGSFTDAGVADTHTVRVDWGDGFSSDAEVTGTTYSATHMYLDDRPSSDDSHVFDVEVTVTDDDEGVASGATSVTIQNAAPEIVDLSTVTRPIGVGALTQLVIEFTDPGLLDTFTTEIRWGDGQVETIDVPTGHRSFVATHQYLDSNPAIRSVFTIAVAITDDDGLADRSTTSLSFGNEAPNRLGVGLGAVEIDEGETLTLHGAFADSGVFDSHTLAVDWGDGTSEAAAVPSRQRQFTIEHTYLEDSVASTGSEEVTVSTRVSDQFGAVSNTGVTAVEIHDLETGVVIESTIGVPTISVRNVAPALDINRPVLEAQYSDAIGDVELVATDVAADPMDLVSLWGFEGAAKVSGVPSGLTISGFACSVSVDANRTSCRSVLTGIADFEPGRYVIDIVVADDDGAQTVSPLVVEVAPEEVSVEYTGPTSLTVKDSQQVVELSALIAEADPVGELDGDRGDITKASVAFVDADTGLVLCAVDEVVPSTDGGEGTCGWTVDSTDAVDQYQVRVEVGGWYRAVEEVATTVSLTRVLDEALAADTEVAEGADETPGRNWALMGLIALLSTAVLGYGLSTGFSRLRR